MLMETVSEKIGNIRYYTISAAVSRGELEAVI